MAPKGTSECLKWHPYFLFQVIDFLLRTISFVREPHRHLEKVSIPIVERSTGIYTSILRMALIYSK